MIHAFLFIRKNDKHIRIHLSDIQYIEAAGSYLVLVTSREQFSLSQNLSQFMRKNPLESLVRVHRSFIVNVNAVDSFDREHVYIKKHRIPIGTSFRDEFLKSVHCL